MGVFDDNTKVTLDYDRKRLMNDNHMKFMVGTSLLRKDELCSLLDAISFDPNEPGAIYPRDILKHDTVVIVSEKEVYYEGLNHIAKLGQHCLNNPAYDGRETIELFINSIRSSAQSNNVNPEIMVVSVFIHELHHSLFHKYNPIPEIEEPLSELGALLFMNSWLYNDDTSFKSIFESIRDKKGKPEISFYGLGADLFCSVRDDDYTVYQNSYQLISAYRGQNINPDIGIVKEYRKRFPLLYACEENCETKKLLARILGCNSVISEVSVKE